MTNLKKNGKKGFTLAELLIVVAIIAVLTAIAVPLFVGALNKAEDSVKEANIRAVRSEAVSTILLAKPVNSSGKDGKNIYTNTNTGEDKATAPSWKLKGPWFVTAYVSSSGEVFGLTIALKESGAFETTEKTACVENADGKDETKGLVSRYKVTLRLELEDIGD